MIPNWPNHLASTVRQLSTVFFAEHEQESDFQLLGKKVDALPVYYDLGGCLLIAPTGKVLSYAWHTEAVEEVTDEQSILRVMKAAAEKYQVLRILEPVRPRAASTCRVCEGRGWIVSVVVTCGNCLGLGWK